MASNGGRPSTTTTTTTNTTISFSQSRHPRNTNQSLHPASAASSRNALTARTHDGTTTPRMSDTNTASIEPFPQFPDENPRSSHLSQVRTQDPFPMSSATLSHIPSNVSSSRAPPNSSTIHVRRRPIGIKRLSSQNVRAEAAPLPDTAQATGYVQGAGRRRSTSAPQRPTMLEDGQDGSPLQHSYTATSNLPALVEGEVSKTHPDPDAPTADSQNRPHALTAPSRPRGGSQRMRRVSDAARSAVSRLSNRSEEQPLPTEYDDGIVDVLDVIDPEVSTLTTLTNVQNSLFVPDLGRWLNRRPTFDLTQGPSYRSHRPTLNRGYSKPLPPTPTPASPPPKATDVSVPSDIEEEPESPAQDRRLSLVSVPSIASVVQEEHYAVLPHGMSLEGWSEEDKELLDDHVRHMLHSRREGFKRSMRAFGKYIRKPLGFLVTLYAVLITLFGLAWVLFLIGWIYVGERQLYVINIIDNVLVALFAIVGDGMAPFRAVDTYHMGFIAYYHHQTEKIRKQRALPKLQDQNELPEVHESEVDVEASVKEGDAEFSVLTPEQQKKLVHHQNKFSKSHSFYKPHETTTHRAFPHHLFVAIVILLDLHSCLQISLGACTWGISYHVRPEALTATILSCSITVNITAGILIKVGDKKTRKKDVLTRMFRQELTEEAMRKLEKQKDQEKEDKKLAMQEQKKEKSVLRDRIEEEKESEGSQSGSASGSRSGSEKGRNRDSSATVQYSPQLPAKTEPVA